MKQIARMMIMALALLLPGQISRAAEAAAPVFFQNLADVPLMPGLTETPDGVVFDKPEGRIVEAAAASSTLSPSAITAFYDMALPQLGWRRTGPGHYDRQGESLALTVEEKDSRRIVHITVTPGG